MNVTEQAIITLLRSAVTGEKLALPENVDMDFLIRVVARHMVVPMAYIGAVNCGVDKEHPVMEKLFRGYCHHLMTSEAQLRMLDSVFAAFDANKIDYMPVKGCNLKQLYPKPELRPMGDGDILIRMEQYDTIRPIMEGLGFRERIESDHELIWQTPELFLELHKRLIPSYNTDYYAYYGDGWRLAKVRNGTRYAMTDEDQFIYLFTHLSKHYRDGGIGLRHVTDLWVYLQAHPELDQTYIRSELKKLSLLAFYENMYRVLEAWFADGEWDERTQLITGFVFGSGPWGTAEAHTASSIIKKAKKTGSLAKGKWQWFWRMIFPDVEEMSYKYPAVKKVPVLLPVFWVVRWVHTLLFRKAVVRGRRQDIKNFSQEKIRKYKTQMEYVGLGFNFGEEEA